LREPGQKGMQVTVVGNTTVISQSQVRQRNILLRILYFVLIGWWLSAIVMELAWFLCLTILGMPLGFWLFDKVPAVLSLHRN
jgi:uncharacterized membrane protein YccF (DUF307 family)